MKDAITGVAISPDWQYAVFCAPGLCEMVDAVSGKLYVYPGLKAETNIRWGADGWIYSVDRLNGSNDMSVNAYDISSGNAENIEVYRFQYGKVAFSPDALSFFLCDISVGYTNIYKVDGTELEWRGSIKDKMFCDYSFRPRYDQAAGFSKSEIDPVAQKRDRQYSEKNFTVQLVNYMGETIREFSIGDMTDARVLGWVNVDELLIDAIYEKQYFMARTTAHEPLLLNVENGAIRRMGDLINN